MIVHPNGSLSLIPHRSQISARPKGSIITAAGVVSFAKIYRQIAESVVAESGSVGDRLVYFARRGANMSGAVFIPAAKAKLAQSLFAKFASDSGVTTRPESDED